MTKQQQDNGPTFAPCQYDEARRTGNLPRSPMLYIQSLGVLILAIGYFKHYGQESDHSTTVFLHRGGHYYEMNKCWPLLYVLILKVVLNQNVRAYFVSLLHLLGKDTRTEPTDNEETFPSHSPASPEPLTTLSRVSSREAISRLSASIKSISIRSCRKQQKRELAISASECFISTNDIAGLSLNDIATIFRYAIESNRSDFDKTNFLKDVRPSLQELLATIDLVISQSMGSGVIMKTVSDDGHPSGDVDALLWLAAVRIFAEWRTKRLVPPGYKGYATGLELARRDLVQNVSKIETAVHEWLDDQCDALQEEDSVHMIESPTLRQLIQHEVLHVHTNLPKLKDKSAASGLLWAKRQLDYQTSVFENTLQVPESFSSTRDAVLAAYQGVYSNFHSWAIRQIFHHSLRNVPTLEEIFQVMNPQQQSDDLCRDNESTCSSSGSSIVDSWERESNSSCSVISAAVEVEPNDDEVHHHPLFGLQQFWDGFGDVLSDHMNKVETFFSTFQLHERFQ